MERHRQLRQVEFRDYDSETIVIGQSRSWLPGPAKARRKLPLTQGGKVLAPQLVAGLLRSRAATQGRLIQFVQFANYSPSESAICVPVTRNSFNDSPAIKGQGLRQASNRIEVQPADLRSYRESEPNG
jgi:hypothetical protein